MTRKGPNLRRMGVLVSALLSVLAWSSSLSAQRFSFPARCPGCVTWITYYAHGTQDWNCGGRTYWDPSPHRGTDYAMPRGNEIIASADGTVIGAVDGYFDACTSGACSGTNMVTIRNDSGSTSEYLHMQRGSVAVSVGQRVGCGQFIGRVASSGASTGNHVHFQFWLPGSSWSNRLDPFHGPCSGGPSYWANQGGYLGTPAIECGVDRDGDGSLERDDCDDNDANRRPGRAESCDNRDNDCDPSIDEGLARACGTDVGECVRGEQTCAAGAWGVCVGEVAAEDESCDLRDNNCDGAIDDQRICEHEDAALASALFARVSSDVDGDGRADACVRTPAGFECLTSAPFGFDRAVRGPLMRDEDGWNVRAMYTSLRMGDVDGDGLDDLCTRTSDRIVCWAASGVGFEESLVTMALGQASPSAQHAELWLADMDGDARVDVCARGVDGLRCQPSRGGALRVLHALSDEEGFADVGRHGSIRFGDVNGDGRDDVCARDADGISCWLASDAGFLDHISGPRWSDALGWDAPRYGSTIRLVDVDGDERDDVCGRGPDGFVCVLANERGFGSVHRGPLMRGEDWDARDVYSTLRMGDVDGDGASDVCLRTPQGMRCWLWTGESFSDAIIGPALTNAEGWSEAARYTSVRLADVNGDARADLCARASDGLRCWLSEGTHFARQWRASAWNDAAGLSDPSFASTLTIGGIGARAPTSLHGGCACHVHARPRRGWPVALLIGAIGLAVARRRSHR